MSDKKLVYTAMPKYLAGMDSFIGKYVYDQGCVPLTPWQYPFWLMDTVDRDRIRNGNSRYIEAADEVWIFSTSQIFEDSVETIDGLDIHDGVKREIEEAKELDMVVRLHHFDEDSQKIEFVRELH